MKSIKELIQELLDYGIPKSIIIDELCMSRKTFLKYMDCDGFKEIHRVAIYKRWNGLFVNEEAK